MINKITAIIDFIHSNMTFYFKVLDIKSKNNTLIHIDEVQYFVFYEENSDEGDWRME